VPTSAPAANKELNNTPRLKPGPPPTHDWFAIWSEILRRCINPQTGLIAFPKKSGKPMSELKFAEAVAVWYENKFKRSVNVTDVRVAVKGVCIVLKEIQSHAKSQRFFGN
jgi:hypothetical protein